MASKRLGRLRQWAGEMVSSKDKSEVTEEARELERDIETRSDGLRRLHAVGTLYHRSISKKKATDAVDDEGKMLPRDALGVVMIVHGEQLEGSLYGSSLVKLGQAHCKVALAQEALALTLQSSYLETLQASAEEIKEYEVERKALETRRINYDAAVIALEKVQANKKSKEKDRDLAEDEVVKAKMKYDEQAEDLRARIEAIQDHEVEQLRDLTGMLDAELAFAEQYAEILRDVKRDWAPHASLNRLPSRREVGPMHHFARTPDLDGSTNGSPEIPARSRSKSVPRKRTGSSATAKRQPVEDSAVDSDSDASDEEQAPVMSRRSSKASKPASRPPSRGARSRANSAATAKGDKTDDEEKGKHSRRPSSGAKSVEDKESKAGKRMSVAGWMPSIGRKKGPKVDRDLFANLQEDESDGEAPPVSSAVSSRSFGSIRSKKSAGASSPVIPPRPHRDTDAKQPKLVRATHDFAGSSDELSFISGDVIAVVSEVLDGWWMGELDGHRGLFPTTHTEEFRPTTPRIRPALPGRSGTFGGQLSPGHPLPERSHSDEAAAHPFGDEHATTNSLFSPLSATFSGDESAADTHSIADSMDDGAYLMPKKAHDEREDAFGPPGESVRQPPPPPPRRTTTPKVPPPPPPRRAHSNAPSLDSNNAHTLHHSASAGSSLRRPPSSGSSLTGHSSSMYQSASAASSASGHSGTSPSTANGTGKSPWGLRDSETGACTYFEQQLMRAAGMCVNCQRMHLDV